MIVYKATNLVTGKIYIGKTVRTLSHAKARHHERAKRQWKYGCDSYFYASIRKHGWEAFDWKIIDQGETDAEIQQLERDWIAFTGSYTDRKIGYNMTPGGDGGAGRKLSAEQVEFLRDRVSGEGNMGWGKFGEDHPAFGHTKSAEVRAAISRAHKGKVVSPETRAKLSKTRISIFADQKAETERRREVERQARQAEHQAKKAAGAFKGENGRASKVTDQQQRAEICMRRAAGESYRSISEDFPLVLTGVRAVAEVWGPRNGFPFEKIFAKSDHRLKLTDAQRLEVIARYSHGESIADLARSFSVGATTIYSTITVWGPRNGHEYKRRKGAWGTT